MTSADQGCTSDEEPSPQPLQIKEEYINERGDLQVQESENIKTEPDNIIVDQPLDFSNHKDDVNMDTNMAAKDSSERKISHDSGICMQSVLNGRDSTGLGPDSRSITPSSISGESTENHQPPHSNGSDLNVPQLPSEPPMTAAAAAAARLIPGMFPGFPGIPNIPSSAASGVWPNVINPAWAAAMMQDQLMYGQKVPGFNMPTGTNGKSGNTRPFKAYPADALKLPIPYPFSIPAFNPFGPPGDNGTAANTLKPHSDDIYSMYHKALVKAQGDQRKSREGGSSRSNAAASASSDNGHSSKPGHGAEIAFPSNTASPPSRRSSIGKSSAGTPQQLELRHITNGNGLPGSPSEASVANSILTSTQSQLSSVKSPVVAAIAPTPTRRKRSVGQGPVGDEQKDAAYWERRKKNNEAAKRSRDARRAKEDEIAIRAAFLEQENIRLKVEVNALRAEVTKLRTVFGPK